MAIWRTENSMLTSVGVEILNKLKLGDGTGITVTKIVAGSGRVSESQLYNQKAVSGSHKTMSVFRKKVLETGSEISFFITNEDFTEDFIINQLGIYVTHPDYSEEQLYFISQCDEGDQDTLPPFNITPIRLDYSLLLEHGNSSSITVTIDPLGSVDRETFETFRLEVNQKNAGYDQDLEGLKSDIDGLERSVSNFENIVAGLEADLEDNETAITNLSTALSNFKSGIRENKLITANELGHLIASGKHSVSGTSLSVVDAIDFRALSLSVEGSSNQGGTPTPTAPVYLTNTKVSDIRSSNPSTTKVITLPSVIELRSLGDYKDTIEWDGAKWWKVQRIAEVTVDGTTVSFGRPSHSNSANYSRGTLYTLNGTTVQTFNDALPTSPILTSHGNSAPSTTAKFYGFLEASGSITRVNLHILHTAIGLQAGQKDATARLNEIVAWFKAQNDAGTPVKVWYVLNTPVVNEITLNEVLEMYSTSTELSCTAEGNTPMLRLSYALNTTDATTMYILKSLTRKTEVPTVNTFAIATIIEE